MNLVNHTHHPIGTLVPMHQKYASPKLQIVTDTGLMDADGRFLAPAYFPELFRMIGYKHGRGHRDMFKLPNMTAQFQSEPIRLTPAQMPLHSHNFAPNPSPHIHTVGFNPAFSNHTHGYFVGMDPGLPYTVYKKQKLDRNDVIGYVDEVTEDSSGVKFRMKFDSKAFTDEIKKLTELHPSPLITANEARHMLGFDRFDQPKTDMDLFPEMHGIKGMKWGVKRSASSSNTKENNMPNSIVKLKTPTKNIKRKDLRVAMRLFGIARNEDALFDVLALVQSVGENEKIYRISELKPEDLVGKLVRVHSTDASGICSDFVIDDYNNYRRLVIAGKLEQIEGDSFIIVSELPETEAPLGNDTLRMVQD